MSSCVWDKYCDLSTLQCPFLTTKCSTVQHSVTAASLRWNAMFIDTRVFYAVFRWKRQHSFGGNLYLNNVPCSMSRESNFFDSWETIHRPEQAKLLQGYTAKLFYDYHQPAAGASAGLHWDLSNRIAREYSPLFVTRGKTKPLQSYMGEGWKSRILAWWHKNIAEVLCFMYSGCSPPATLHTTTTTYRLTSTRNFLLLE